MYRAVEQEYQEAIDRLSRRLGEGGETNVRQFQTLLRRMSMRTSARNQFVGHVSGLREGEVSFEVRVRLDDANEIVAVITRASAENLELAIGKEVHAFVKAPSVLIITDPAARTTARNHLWGTVSAIHEGPVSSEVTITLPGGLDDFIALVLPELRRRGLFRTEYEGGTLREHLGLARPAHRRPSQSDGALTKVA